MPAASIAKIVATPERWRVLEQDVHICRARVFPYAGRCTIEPDYILSGAIAHGKRRPGYWRHRVTTHHGQEGNPRATLIRARRTIHTRRNDSLRRSVVE